jgi:NAD(P)-dependent dehydrogenase (short-subunit alcohol dehydrogenase family)
VSDRNIWVLGGTSAIAFAYARLRAGQGARLVLIGRNAAHLEANASDLAARGGRAAVEVIDLATAEDRSSAVAGLIARHGQPDEVLVAYGILGDQARAVGDPDHAAAIIAANYTSVVSWLLAVLAARDPGRPLTLAVIGSVAGDRGRGSNFVYGSAKGGLDRFLEGVQHAHAGSNLAVVRIKPGFVDTPMTAGLPKGGPLWAKPEQIAADIARAVDRGSVLVYTPWFWRPIMLIIRHLPRVVFNRLKI